MGILLLRLCVNPAMLMILQSLCGDNRSHIFGDDALVLILQISCLLSHQRALLLINPTHSPEQDFPGG